MADYVSKYTGSEVDGILDEAIELPQSTNNDVGKVLTINNTGEPVWGSVASVPDYTDANDGDILKYSDNSGLIWYTPSSNTSELPIYTEENENTSFAMNMNSAFDGFLMANDDKGPYWINPYVDRTGYTATIGFDDTYALMRVSGSDWDGLQWKCISFLLPEHDSSDNSSDAGKVLTVLDNGNLAWCTPSNGGVDITDANDGDVLKYSSDSGLIWGAAINTAYACDGDILTYSLDSGLVWRSSNQ